MQADCGEIFNIWGKIHHRIKFIKSDKVKQSMHNSWRLVQFIPSQLNPTKPKKKTWKILAWSNVVESRESFDSN